MFSAKQIKASIFSCAVIGGAFSATSGLAALAQSQASSQASSGAVTQSATQAQQGSTSQASTQAASQSSNQAATQASTQAASHSGYANNSRNGLIGTPTVINRGNVGNQILQAAGQTRSVGSSASRTSTSGRRAYSNKRTAHWKTQYWNGKSAATAKAAK